MLGLWSLSLVASVAVGLLLVQLYRQSSKAQFDHAEAVIARACDLIHDRFSFYAAGWSTPSLTPLDYRLRDDLTAVDLFVLARHDAVEGGIWQFEHGPLAPSRNRSKR